MAHTPPDHRTVHPERASAPELLSEAMNHATGMMRGELDLFRAEMQQSLNKAIAAIAMIATGAVLLLVSLNVFAAAFVAWLTESGVGPGWSALIVGGVLVIIAVILMISGKNKLKLVNLAPTRTVRNVQRDAETLKEVRNG